MGLVGVFMVSSRSDMLVATKYLPWLILIGPNLHGDHNAPRTRVQKYSQ